MNIENFGSKESPNMFLLESWSHTTASFRVMTAIPCKRMTFSKVYRPAFDPNGYMKNLSVSTLVVDCDWNYIPFLCDQVFPDPDRVGLKMIRFSGTRRRITSVELFTLKSTKHIELNFYNLIDHRADRMSNGWKEISNKSITSQTSLTDCK